MTAVRITIAEMDQFAEQNGFVRDQIEGYKEVTYSKSLYVVRSRTKKIRVLSREEGDKTFADYGGFDAVIDGRNNSMEVLRVYKLYIASTIVGTVSRPKDSDAIRLFLMCENQAFGRSTRTHRMANWRKHLGDKVNDWRSLVGPACPKCNSPTALRKPKKGQTWKPFHGCIRFKDGCKGGVSAEKAA